VIARPGSGQWRRGVRLAAAMLRAACAASKTVLKVNEGRPNAVDMLKAGSIKLVIYTATGGHSFSDEKAIRRTALAHRRGGRP
jgi:carbamoyl-phosphate synthase large subunit